MRGEQLVEARRTSEDICTRSREASRIKKNIPRDGVGSVKVHHIFFNDGYIQD